MLLGEAVFAPAVGAVAGTTQLAPQAAPVVELGRPAAPIGGYRPHFVHQTRNNCAFAAAAMLIDKWTNGRRRPTQQRLRWASRVPSSSGVAISQVARAVASGAGLRLNFSPGGGDSLTWNALMDRLARGGAAVVAGSYSRLPSHYQRWDRAYASLGASRSGHALYIERFEPGRNGGRVWIMDPLAGGSNYRGEWISANALRRFAWHSSKGIFHAAATPEPPPLAGYEFGSPGVVGADGALAGSTVTISVPLNVRAGWSRPDNLALSVVWTPRDLDPSPESLAADYLAAVAAEAAAAAEGADVSRTPRRVDRRSVEDEEGDDAADDQMAPTGELTAQELAAWQEAVDSQPPAIEEPAEPAAETAEPEPGADAETVGKPMKPILVPLVAQGGQLVAKVDAPGRSGQYSLSFELRRRDGSQFPASDAPRLADVGLRLRGKLALQYSDLVVAPAAQQGSLTTASVRVANLGSLDWKGEDAVVLVATWQTADGSWAAASRTIELAAGADAKITFESVVPSGTDEGSLTLELVTAEGIPFSVYGFAPVTATVEFAAASTSEGLSGAPQE